MTYQLKIKLKSDICCATGGGNGSNIDTLSFFDNIGLPVIPGKRIKGLLREQADLLVKYGKYTSENIEDLFGGLGGKKGEIYVSDGVLDAYDDLKFELQKYRKEEVSDSFSSLRSRTRIDKDGIAVDHSLRTIQTVMKGLEFFSTITVESDKYTELLSDCTKILRHIGLNQTRGLGECECVLEKIFPKENSIPDNFTSPFTLKGEFETYTYKIKLISALATDNDYISGMQIQGIFAEKLATKPYFNDIVLKNTIFGNAYISDGENEFFPVPLSFVAVKNADVSKNNFTNKIYDSACTEFERDDKEQYVSVGGYMRIDTENIYRQSLSHSTEYHYNKKTHDLFAFKKIPAGKVFMGRITLDKNAVPIFKAVCNEILTLGKGRSAEYALCKFEFCEKIVDKKDTVNAEKSTITLLSDMILFDENGNNSGDPAVLKKAFGLDETATENTKVFTKTKLIGGYNNHWKLPKPQYIVFSKGTVLSGIYTGEKEGTKGILANVGYGKFVVTDNVRSEYLETKPLEIKTANSVISEKSAEIANRIEKNRQINAFTKAGLEYANTHFREWENISQSSAMRLFNLFRNQKYSPKEPELPLKERLL
ncbi:MAG: RAMP superfamily CRISPR-associated protein, partial [Oscillospiraceae bacterium]|nr:RAMP superfamily CRISPR-associated protein [Oscillospiraceae bacterium]